MFDVELSVAGEAARRGGDILLRMMGDSHRIIKKGDIDLVTEADLASEKAILESIRRHFPGDAILAEESGKQGVKGPRTWLVDPLDGTTNYAHGFPFFAVSVGLEIENEVVMGVVYNPCMGEFFEAVAGMGAFLNGNPIQVSGTLGFEESLLATGFPYDVHERPGRVLSLLEKILTRAQGVRRLGSAALDLCYVAAGRLDGFWEEDLKPWDTAAGVAMVREAGGRLSTFHGGPYTPHMQTVVASNGWIHEEMVAITRGSGQNGEVVSR